MNDETSDEFCGPPMPSWMWLSRKVNRFLEMAEADPSLLDNCKTFIGGKWPPIRPGSQLTECSDDEL